MSQGKGIVIDFQLYKEKREIRAIEKPASLAEEGFQEDFHGRLHLTQEDAEMVMYCMGLGREYFRIEAESVVGEGDPSHKGLEIVSRLLEMMQDETLNPQSEGGYILSLSFLELSLMIDCVEMARNAVANGINVFQAKAKDFENYRKWLDGTFFYLLEVYEKWRSGHNA